MENLENQTSTVNYDKLDELVRKFQKVFNILVPIIAFVVSLIVVGIIIKIQGGSIIVAYSSLFRSSFGDLNSLGNSLSRAVPLIMAGLGIAIAARANIINLGAEGQIIFGGIFATYVGIHLQGLPPIIHIPLCLLAGFIGGALWAFIPGYFNAKHNTNIIITAMLLNDIAIGVLGALVHGPLKEVGGFSPQSAQIAVSARLPMFIPGSRVHIGIIIALVIAVIAHYILFKTPRGLETRILGGNPVVAKHSGMQVISMQIMLVLIAGGLAGAGGAMEIMGSQFRLREAFLMNYGYEALAVALLGQKSPYGVIIAGILFGALKAGRGGMVNAANLPVSFSMVLSGVLILSISISPILMKIPKYLALRNISGQK